MQKSLHIAGSAVALVAIALLSGCAAQAHKVASIANQIPELEQFIYGLLQGLFWLPVLILQVFGVHTFAFDNGGDGVYIVGFVIGVIPWILLILRIIRRISRAAASRRH